MSKPTTLEIIEWCRVELNRYAQMQGDKNNTNRRRKVYRYRNHMFAATVNVLTEKYNADNS